MVEFISIIKSPFEDYQLLKVYIMCIIDIISVVLYSGDD